MTDRNLSNLCVIYTDGTGNRPLTTGNQNDLSPRWSPDGEKLNYRSDGSGYLKDGYMQLFTLPATGVTPRQITLEADDHGSSAWTKDGNSIFFSANLHKNAEYEPLNSEIYKVDLKTLIVKVVYILKWFEKHK